MCCGAVGGRRVVFVYLQSLLILSEFFVWNIIQYWLRYGVYRSMMEGICLEGRLVVYVCHFCIFGYFIWSLILNSLTNHCVFCIFGYFIWSLVLNSLTNHCVFCIVRDTCLMLRRVFLRWCGSSVFIFL